MVPKVALLLYFIMVVYLLVLDYKWQEKISVYLWIPTIWVLIIGSRMVSLWIPSTFAQVRSPDNYIEGSPIDRTVFIILMFAALIILWRRKIFWSEIIYKNIWLFIFFMYCGLSIMWSDFPFVSFKRNIKSIGDVLMVIVIVTERDPFEALTTIFRRCGYILIPLSIVLIKYYPNLGRWYHRYSGELFVTGVTTSKNSLGELCLICGLFYCWELFRMWRNKNVPIDKKKTIINISIMFMIFWLIVISKCATAQMCLIIGIPFLIMMETQFMRRNASQIGIYSFVAILIFLVLQFTFDILRNIIVWSGHDTTLSGRTELWRNLLDMKTTITNTN